MLVMRSGGEGAASMDRVILHCDLNSFYASVELLSYPELRALPVAVLKYGEEN